MHTSDDEILAVPHRSLTAHQLDQLSGLFDQEYLATHGAWRPEQPYGYAPHDVHVIATGSAGIVGHVGWGRRTITVGGAPLVITGVGGVLISPAARGRGMGRHLMQAAHRSMLAEPGIEYGYLGCAESVAAFYAGCGWHRIDAPERCTGRDGHEVATPPGQPLFIRSVRRRIGEWPDGEVDLRGRPW